MPELVCPDCKRKLRVSDTLAGRRVKCPGCQGVVTVPKADLVSKPPPRPNTRRRRFTAPPPKKGMSAAKIVLIVVGSLAVVGIIGGAVLVFAVKKAVDAKKSSDERMVSASLRSIVMAEENFKSNDLDRNNVSDYWTADVAGLYCIQNAVTSNPIKALSDVEVASADLFPAGGGYRGTGTAYNPSLLLSPAPKGGYVFQALIMNQQTVPPTAYAQNTGDDFIVHSFGTYGFMAMPMKTEGPCFIVNEGASVFRRDFGKMTLTPAFGERQTTFDGKTPCDFFAASELSAQWKKAD